jgi:glycosyltransferase involved in cell wall biosynthesis
MQMLRPPLVSIIVPAYRAAPYIAEALNSVLAQTFQDFEIVVVNDGCPETKALEDALQNYRSRIVYVKQESQGPAVARNTGITHGADTKYIALLDADDKWETNYLEVQTGMMEANPTIDVLYSDAILFGDKSVKHKTFMRVCPSHGEVSVESLVNQTCNVMVSVLARREAVVRAGMFDPAFRGNEDFDLWLRIAKGGGRIAYHRRALVHYRRHPNSLSASRPRMCSGYVAVMQKFLQRSDTSEAERRMILSRIDYVRAVMAWDEGRTAVQEGNSSEAVENFRRANRVLRNPWLSALIVALRFFPRLAMPAYLLRRRMSGAR